MSRSLFAFAPTIGWTLLMVLPFLYMNFWFADESRLIQAIGILVTWVALCFSDWYFAKREIKKRVELSRATWSRLGLFSFVTLVCISVFHVISMPEIPFIKLLQGVNGRDLEEVREQAWKNLAVSELFKYLFQWVPNLLFPLTLAIFLHLRKKSLSLLLVFLALAYSFTSGVKLIPVLTGVVILLYAYIHFSPASRRLLFRSSLGVGGFIGLLVALNLTFNPDSLFRSPSVGPFPEQSVTDEWQPTPLDYFRWEITHGKDYKEVPFITKISNFIVYRIFLVPVEVSQRWYAFYPAIKGHHMGLYGLTPEARSDKDFVNLSREVGLWAYYSRYEGKIFGPTISANASVDADLWARYGFIGLLVLPFFLFFMRAALFFTMVWDEPFRFVSRFAILLYSILLPMASLQAILIPHGFIVYAAVGAFGGILYWRMNSNESPI